MRGLVIKNTGSWYSVKTDDGKVIESKIKGNFRLKGIRSTNPVAVGDLVEIVTNQEGTAFITKIEDRRNYIIRKSQNLSKQVILLQLTLIRLSFLLQLIIRRQVLLSLIVSLLQLRLIVYLLYWCSISWTFFQRKNSIISR